MLIGITGPAGAGKDTVADYLVQEHFFHKLAFAGPLKEMLATAGFPEPADRALKEAKIAGFDFTWREAAQRLGTEFGRALDPEIWTKIIRGRINSFCRIGGDVVISDVRFENEAAMIRGMGGTILHLHGRRADLGAAAAHVSEAGVFCGNNDHTIINTGPIYELQRSVDVILEKLR